MECVNGRGTISPPVPHRNCGGLRKWILSLHWDLSVASRRVWGEVRASLKDIRSLYRQPRFRVSPPGEKQTFWLMGSRVCGHLGSCCCDDPAHLPGLHTPADHAFPSRPNLNCTLPADLVSRAPAPCGRTVYVFVLFTVFFSLLERELLRTEVLRDFLTGIVILPAVPGTSSMLSRGLWIEWFWPQ